MKEYENYGYGEDHKQVEINKINENRKSTNMPFQNKADSFIITSANNSFARDYNDNDWYSGKPTKLQKKHQTRTPNTKYDSDQQFSKIYSRGSEPSHLQDQSRVHRRINSEDLILEENTDFPSLSAILKDIKHLLTHPVSETDPEFLMYHGYSKENHIQLSNFAKEILAYFNDKFKAELSIKEIEYKHSLANLKIEYAEAYSKSLQQQSFRTTDTYTKSQQMEEERLRNWEQTLKKDERLRHLEMEAIKNENLELKRMLNQSSRDIETQKQLFESKNQNSLLLKEKIDLEDTVSELKQERAMLKTKNSDLEYQLEQIKHNHTLQLRNVKDEANFEANERIDKIRRQLNEDLLAQMKLASDANIEKDKAVSYHKQLIDESKRYKERLAALEDSYAQLIDENRELKSKFALIKII